MLRIIFTVLLFVFSIVANGELYKWVDNNGKTQYTDQPPPAGAATTEKKLEIKLAPVQPAEDKAKKAGKNLAERELDFISSQFSEMPWQLKIISEILICILNISI